MDLIDFRYITDALTPEEALEILTKAQEGKKERLQEALDNKAVPAYTTSAGWLGYGEVGYGEADDFVAAADCEGLEGLVTKSFVVGLGFVWFRERG